MNKIIIWLTRISFMGWLGFEFLNLVGVLHFTLDFSWLGIMLTASFIWASIEISNKRIKKSTGQGLPWIVYAAGLLGTSWDALGDVAHFYSRYEWYDQAAHLFGGGMAALLVFFVFWRLKQSGKMVMGDKMLAFFAICVSSFLGVIYEVEEYLEDVFFNTNRLGLGTDTANDLMWNEIGAVAFVVAAVFIIKRKLKNNTPERSRE